MIAPRLLPIALLAAACAGPGSSLLSAHPELRPGATTWDALAAARASDDHTSGGEHGPALPPTLDGILSRAIERNPDVRGSRQAWRAAIGAVASAGVLPNPRVGYTYLPQPVETRVGPNEHRIALTQVIPSPVRLVAQHQAAVARVGSARYRHEATVLRVLADVKGAAAEVRYLQRSLAAVSSSEQVVQELAGAAAERYGTSRGLLFDVNKARSQLAQLGYDRVRFAELLAAARARLNALLDRDPRAPVPMLAAWPRAQLPPSLEALYRRALEHEPGLRALDAQIEERMAGVTDARGRFVPNISLSVQYLVNGQVRPTDTGDDAVGLTIGLELPLWFGSDAGRVDQAEAELARSVESKRAHINRLLAEVEAGLYRLRNARRLVALYDKTLLPEATQAIADAEAWFKEDVGGFTDFLEARATWYRFVLARERADADRAQAEAALERRLGEALALESGGADPPRQPEEEP